LFTLLRKDSHFNLLTLQTAQALLDAMMTDDKHTVRQMALSIYIKHPQRHQVTRDHENVMLRYDTHALDFLNALLSK
jgi:hypothetical protein